MSVPLCVLVERTKDALGTDLDHHALYLVVGERVSAAIKEALAFPLWCLAGSSLEVVDRGAGEGDQVAQQFAQGALLLSANFDRINAVGPCPLVLPSAMSVLIKLRRLVLMTFPFWAFPAQRLD